MAVFRNTGSVSLCWTRLVHGEIDDRHSVAIRVSQETLSRESAGGSPHGAAGGAPEPRRDGRKPARGKRLDVEGRRECEPQFPSLGADLGGAV